MDRIKILLQLITLLVMLFILMIIIQGDKDKGNEIIDLSKKIEKNQNIISGQIYDINQRLDEWEAE